ncbi:MAG: hypothetical protein HY866_00180 [Chloroflexi bacterium]|nr:hypothetical protein [Chloroflexota bacterium]
MRAALFTPEGRTSCLLRLLLIWGCGFYALLAAVIMLSDDTSPDDRAIILMAGGLLVFWVILGGLIQRRGRDRFVRWANRLPFGWRVRFVLLCILMALIEEAITTGMTNLGPWLGAESDKAAITASKNYLEVVLLNSVIVFVPMYIAWAWMLARWAFRPVEVLLLYGITGCVAESISFGPQNLIMLGMWVYVYGLMVWLPAHTVPPDRSAHPPRWWHWPLAVILPIVATIPFVPVVLLVRAIIGID